MNNEYITFDDIDKSKIISILNTNNEHLDKVTIKYFASKIKEPIIGENTFEYVQHHFDYALKEYSITHSKKINPSENPTREELLSLNNISIKLFEQYIQKINKILETYTDKEWSLEKKQINLLSQLKILADYEADEEAPEFKLSVKLNNIDIFDNRTTRYIKSILDLMSKGGINQIKDNKYIVIENLIKLYIEMKQYLITYDFKEKKSYLKELNKIQAENKLHDYITKILNDKAEEKPIHKIRWFIFYLIYDGKKSDIFMIHSILGYKFDIAKKLYQKLFFKDHNTGKNDIFLHHTDVLNITTDNLYIGSRLYEQIINSIKS